MLLNWCCSLGNHWPSQMSFTYSESDHENRTLSEGVLLFTAFIACNQTKGAPKGDCIFPLPDTMLRDTVKPKGSLSVVNIFKTTSG